MAFMGGVVNPVAAAQFFNPQTGAASFLGTAAQTGLAGTPMMGAGKVLDFHILNCLLYTSPSPRDRG